MTAAEQGAPRRVHLGLGSNLGERWRHLATALGSLVEIDPGLVVSSVFETLPVGGPKGQGRYLNAVVAMSWLGSPAELLDLAHELEDQAGRVRLERFGPRSLDVDVLFFSGVTSDAPELTLPHPRVLERAFVLAPLEEVAPELVPARWRESLGGDAEVEGAARRVGVIVPSRPSPAQTAGAPAQVG